MTVPCIYLKQRIAVICETHEAKKAAAVVRDVTIIDAAAWCSESPTSLAIVPAFLSCLASVHTRQYTKVSSAPMPENNITKIVKY